MICINFRVKLPNFKVKVPKDTVEKKKAKLIESYEKGKTKAKKIKPHKPAFGWENRINRISLIPIMMQLVMLMIWLFVGNEIVGVIGSSIDNSSAFSEAFKFIGGMVPLIGLLLVAGMLFPLFREVLR